MSTDIISNLFSSLLESSDGRAPEVQVIPRVFHRDVELKYEEAKEKYEDKREKGEDVLSRSLAELRDMRGRIAEGDILLKEDLDTLHRLEKERDEIKLELTETKEKLSKALTEKVEITKEQVSKRKELQKLFKLIRQAEKVDLCFLLDCTGSMSSYISAVKDQIRAIISRLGKFSKVTLKCSFVGYRDICDGQNQFETLDFNDSIEKLESFLGEIRAFGGGDGPEDIAGGVQKVRDLNWSQGTRVLIHIADAPAHGSKYNNGMSDDFPDGTDVSLPEQVQKLIEEKQVMYYFSHVNRTSTGPMIECLNKEIGRETAIVELDISSSEGLAELVTSTVVKSVSKSFCLEDGESDHAGAKSLELDINPPDWTDIPFVTVEIERIADTAYTRAEDLKRSDLHIEKFPLASKLQIAPKIMGQGKMREARFGNLVLDDGSEQVVILKQLKKSTKDVNLYWECLEQDAIAKFLAEQFTYSKACPEGVKVDFLQNALVKVENGDLYLMEAVLPKEDTFSKFVDNAAHWNEALLDKANTLPKFVQFVHDLTDAYLIVTDLQGMAHENEYLLTDPAILCSDESRFGKTNLGENMMDEFMESLESFELKIEEKI